MIYFRLGPLVFQVIEEYLRQADQDDKDHADR